jgi:hypothetical protein
MLWISVKRWQRPKLLPAARQPVDLHRAQVDLERQAARRQPNRNAIGQRHLLQWIVAMRFGDGAGQ